MGSTIEHGTGRDRVRAAVSRLIELLRVEKDGLYVVLVYAVGIGVASLAAPIGVQMLVNAIAFGGLAQPILVLSVLALVTLAFAATLRGAQAWVVEQIQQRLFVRVATDLAARLPRLSTAALETHHGPELVNRFFDVVTVQKGAAMLLLDAIFVALQMLIGGGVLALYHPALLAFAAALLLAVFAILFGLGLRGATTSLRESTAKYDLVAWFDEVARHPTLFRSEETAAFASTRSHDLVREHVDARRTHYGIVFRQTAAFLALQAIATAALLAIGGVLVLRGQLTLGQLVAAELIVTALVAGFAKLGKYLESYYDLIAAMDKLGKLVSVPLEREGGATLARGREPLAIRIVGAEYAHDARSGPSPARVSFDVPAGAHVAVVGPNGSGKSTLIDLVFGLREPMSGYVEIDGMPLRELSLRAVRDEMALVRGAAVFDGTIMENVCMGRTGIGVEDVRSALESVGLWDEIAALPDGLSTRVATTGANLSAGQAQRLAIARAIVARPRCLLLDEALDDLDPDVRERVLGGVLGEDAPWTAMVATHDPSIARACRRRYVLSMGEAA